MDNSSWQIIDRLPEPALLVSATGKIVYANSRATRLLQRSPEALHDILEVTAEDPDRVKRFLRLCSRSPKPIPVGFRIQVENRTREDINLSGFLFNPAQNDEPALVMLRFIQTASASSRFLVLNREIEKQNLNLKLLSDSRDELSRIKFDLQDYVGIVDKYVITSSTDRAGIITYASEAFCKISGYTKEELIGHSHNIVRHPDMPAELYVDLWKTISTGKVWRGEIMNLSKDGSSYWVDVNIEPKFDKSGAITGYTAIRQDITDKKLIEKISVTDHLTQLSNRAMIDDVLRHEIERTVRYSRHVSLILFDLDHFKRVNDENGHLVGDNVLKQVARLTRKRVRETDTAARWGGEEFLIICPETALDGAAELAERLRKDIENHNFDCAATVTCSFGVVRYDINESQISLIKRADHALYEAKQSGRNRVVAG